MKLALATRIQRFWLVSAMILLALSTCWSDGPQRADDDAVKVEAPRRAQRLTAMRKIAGDITVEAVEEGQKQKVDLVDGARFRFSSPVTPCYDATVWVWGPHGRPAALLALSAERTGHETPSYWAYELTSISPLELSVSSPDGWTWTPQAAALRFAAVPDASAPAEKASVRARQMKDIALRFDAHGVAGSGRYELRVLPTPIHSYSDKSGGILDGGLFFIAGGTDPEVLLVIEAAIGDDGQPKWQFAINRVSSAELHARLDGKEIWSSPRVGDATNRSPYYLFSRPMLNELGDE
jgi:hypothetical protein